MRKYSVLILSLLLCLTVANGCKQSNKNTQSDAYNQATIYYKAKKYDNAFKLFSELAEEGDDSSQSYLGIMYMYGLGVRSDSEGAKYWLVMAAEKGVVGSMIALADMYKNGIGTIRDCEKGLYWYNKASESGDTMAMYSLSRMYRYGICVEADNVEEINYLYKAAQVNDEYGLLCRALILFDGTGGEKNYLSAMKLFEEISDEYDSPLSYLYLYSIYYYGYGVDVNIPMAFTYLKKASDLDLAGADYTFAAQFFTGEHLEKDYKKAHHYAMKSQLSESGSAYILGVLYEQGFGVPVDTEEAKKWYRQAVDMGNEKAKKRFSALQ